ISMSYKDFFRLFLEGSCPSHKSFIICMSADSRHPDDFSVYMYFFSEKFYFCGSFDQGSSQCSNCLISHKKYRTLLSPEVVFQMMFNTSCITHSAGRQNNFWLLIHIDRSRLVTGNRQL